MREAFAHDAVLHMGPDADLRAPGAAITRALCGDWEHQPPCPLAPHYSHATAVDGEVHLRVLFAVEPKLEEVVRRHIDRALLDGLLVGPDGPAVRWQLCTSRRGVVAPHEADHPRRLVQG